MSLGPKLKYDPLEILTNDFIVKEPYTNKFWETGVCGFLGFIACTGSNVVCGRPFLSGLQKTFLVTAVAAAFGQYIHNYRLSYLAERDAAYRHYVQTHPEDFPVRVPKKFSEIIEPWVPIR